MFFKPNIWMLLMAENSNVFKMLKKIGWFDVLSIWNFTIMTSRRYLKIRTTEEKWKVLINDMNKQDVSGKYGILKNTVSKWLKYKEKILPNLEKSSTHPKPKKMCTAGLWGRWKSYISMACKKESKCTQWWGFIEKRALDFVKQPDQSDFKPSEYWLWTGKQG